MYLHLSAALNVESPRSDYAEPRHGTQIVLEPNLDQLQFTAVEFAFARRHLTKGQVCNKSLFQVVKHPHNIRLTSRMLCLDPHGIIILWGRVQRRLRLYYSDGRTSNVLDEVTNKERRIVHGRTVERICVPVWRECVESCMVFLDM
jgi:hypothetical protein